MNLHWSSFNISACMQKASIHIYELACAMVDTYWVITYQTSRTAFLHLWPSKELNRDFWLTAKPDFYSFPTSSASIGQQSVYFLYLNTMIAYQVQKWCLLTVRTGACPENYSTYIIRFSQIYRNIRHSLQIIVTSNSDTDQKVLKIVARMYMWAEIW